MFERALEVAVLSEVGLIAIVGAAAALAARALRQPTVVGFLVAGLLVGPVLGLVRAGSFVEALGEFGIALLLFLVGLDLTFAEVRAVGPPALVAGLGQLAGSAAGGYFLALALGFTQGEALFLAAALAFSSTVVVVKILMDLGDLRATYGRLAVGIFLVQDVVVILLLTVLPVMGAGDDITATGLAREGGLAVAQMALLAAGALFASRTFLPPMFRLGAEHPTLLVLLGLMWLFAAFAATSALAVSVEVGAFIAGLSLAGLPTAGELRRRVRPLLDLFLALFFVGLAAGVSLDRALDLLPGALAFTAFVVIGNAVVLTLVLGLMGYPRETSLRTGITVGQVSEFSIVLAALALTQGLIDERVRDFVILVTMMTIAVSAVLIWQSRRIHDLLARLRAFRMLPAGERGVEATHVPHEGHVLMLGWDELAPQLMAELSARGERVVVLDAREGILTALPEGATGVYADPEDPGALEAAGIHAARLVIVNLPRTDIARLVLGLGRPVPPVIARAETEEDARLLRGIGALVLSPSNAFAQAAADAVQERVASG